MALNELADAAGSTLDRDELLDRSLAAVTGHLRFDRALVLLVDEDARRRWATAGRSVAARRWPPRSRELALPLDAERSTLVQLLPRRRAAPVPRRRPGPRRAQPGLRPDAGGELVPRARRSVPRAGRVGVLAVDNRLSGRDVRPGDGPLLYTVGSLIAAAVENARLYAEVEEQKAALERRVVERTAALAAVIEEAQAARATAEAASGHQERVPRRTSATSCGRR